MSSSFSKLSKSSISTEYGTPIEFFKKLDNIFHFKLDPATTPDNPLGTEKFYTKEQDGLKQEWNCNTYINPPFGSKGNIIQWIKKMKSEFEKTPSNTYVMLLPARTDSIYIQDNIWKYQYTFLHFIKGRLKFVNPILNMKNEPHIIGSMLWLLGDYITLDQKDKLNELIPGISVKYGGGFA